MVETVAFSEGPILPQPTVMTRPSGPFNPRIETWMDTQLPEVVPVPRIGVPEAAPTSLNYEPSVPDIHPDFGGSHFDGTDTATLIPPQPGASTLTFSSP